MGSYAQRHVPKIPRQSLKVIDKLGRLLWSVMRWNILVNACLKAFKATKNVKIAPPNGFSRKLVGTLAGTVNRVNWLKLNTIH